MKLVVALGAGIDTRGGHAAGYVSITKHSIKYCRKLGRWLKAKNRFLTSASDGNTCVMHSRWATCGDRNQVLQAHPFAVKRDGQIKLFGCHNGMITGAYESAKKHGRSIDVDSQEIFELLADKDYDGIRSLGGYGVITWVDPKVKDVVNLVKLSAHGDICVVRTKEGGIVWGSTWSIVSDGLKTAGLTCKSEWKDLEVGRVYQIHPSEFYQTDITDIKLGNMYSGRHSYGWSNWDGDDEDTDAKPSTNHTNYSGKYFSGYSNRYVPVCDGMVDRVNGDKEWYADGKLHRENGPAIIKKNGDKEWWYKGQQHRDGGPAVERVDGGWSYYQHGKLHREDGPGMWWPAKKDTTEWKGWYLYNTFYRTEEEWEAAKKKLAEEKETQKQEATEQDKKDQASKESDHAFMRELKQFWAKCENDDETKDEWGDEEKSRFLLKGIMG